MKHIFVLAMLCPLLALAQPTIITPLTIGDTLPDIPLSGTINYKTSSTSLSSFKGKWLILDFWEGYCSSCIAALPRIDSLNKKFSNKLQVLTVTTHGTAAQVLAELQRIKITRNTKLPILVNDTTLVKYFPHQLLSHVVWIDGNGVVKAITGADYITEANIRTALAGQPLSWPVKADVIDFDYTAPFLSPAGRQALPSSFFYSAFTAHRPGLNATNSTSADSATGALIINYFNTSLLQLARLSLENVAAGINPKKLVAQVADPGLYWYQPAVGPYSQWAQQNTWCYSLSLPLSTGNQEQRRIIRQDLSRWLQTLFGLSLSKQKRSRPVWVLTRSGSGKELSTSGAAPGWNLATIAPLKTMTNKPVSDFVWYLNEKIPGIPWIIDETGLSQSLKTDLSLRLDSFTNLPALQKELNRYGLDLTPAERELEVYVLTENNSKEQPGNTTAPAKAQTKNNSEQSKNYTP